MARARRQSPAPTHPLQQAGREQIIAEPDDNAHRLIYADWLMENGDAARGEFIKVQCQLAEMPENSGDEYWKLRRREAELYNHNHERWAQELGIGGRVRCIFRRGFIEEASAHISTLRRFTHAWPQAFATNPIRGLALDGHFTQENIDGLQHFPQFRQLHTLRLRPDSDFGSAPHHDEERMLQFLRSDLSAIKELELDFSRCSWSGNYPFAGQVIEALAGNRTFAPHTLKLRGLCLNQDAQRRLTRTPWVKELRRLTLDSRSIVDTVFVNELAANPDAAALEALRLEGCVFGQTVSSNIIGLLLSENSSLSGLKELAVLGVEYCSPFFHELANAPKAANLQVLHLRERPGSGSRFREWIDALDLRALWSGDSRLKNLRTFGLDGHFRGDDVPQRMAESGNFTHLTSLELGSLSMGDQDRIAENSFNNPVFSRLQQLRLDQHNDLSFFAHSTHLGALRSLSQLSPQEREALAAPDSRVKLAFINGHPMPAPARA